MFEVNTLRDVYSAIEELITLYKDSEYAAFSSALNHRMHKVSWTCSSELYEELSGLLKEFLEANPNINADVKKQVKRLIVVIEAAE